MFIFVLTLFKDHVFRGNSTNQKIFDHCVKSTIQNVIKGLSGTVFTYGQPGSGKTHVSCYY